MSRQPPTDQPTAKEHRAAIGERLRRVREQEGESQVRFAARLGVRKLALLTYERGGTSPGADRLGLLAQTGVDASYVAFGSPSLATPQARARFASALERVRSDAAGAATPLSEVDLVEAAWRMFCEAAG